MVKLKKKLYLVCWYFPSFGGGAEKSILVELKKYVELGYSVKILSFDENYSKGKFESDSIQGENFPIKYNLSWISRHLTFFINYFFILNILNSYDGLKESNLILTQTINAPLVSRFCVKNNLRYNYYLRDENYLNIFNNYEVGFNFYLKFFKNILEFPFLLFYSINNRFALKNANLIISNSKFLNNLLNEKFDLNSKIILPSIDFSKLNKKLMKNKKKKYITFIGGGNSMKGYDIVLKIAKKMPDVDFLIIGKNKSSSNLKNIKFISWGNNIMDFYSITKILLVPSRWQEAFGRVVLEASYLGIPVISSSRGGLLESNKYVDLIVYDLENIDVWVEKIKKLIN